MAKDGTLEIEIGADIAKLNKGISDAENLIRKLQKEKQANLKLGIDVSSINPQLSEAKNNLKELQTQLSGTSVATNGMTKSVGNGSNALMQFSRIVQDAPFGIIGIGNNLTATGEAFGHLRQSTGSAGGALRAMASSFMGTGGILLGVSLLTTGFTLLAKSGLTVGDIIDKITGNFNEFGDAIKKSSEEGAKSATGEIISLKALVSAAQNKSLADKDRLIAIEKLQKQYPGYFGNLSKEEIMTSNLTGLVKDLAKALVARAVAEKLTAASADLQLSIYKKNAELVKQKNNTAKAEARFDKAKAESNIQGIIDFQRQINYSKNAENEYRQEIVSTTNALERRSNVINQLTASSIKLEASQIPKEKNPKVKKPKINKNAGNEFTPFLNPFQSAVIPPISLTFTDPTEGFLAFNAKAKLGLTTLEASWLTTVTNIGSLMESAIEGGVFNIGDAIGNALVNGDNVLQAAGGSLLQTLGGFISGIAKEMIEFGILTAAFGTAKEALSKAGISGGVAIAAGIALSVVGAAISASGKKVSSAAGGKSTSTSSGADSNSSTRVTGGFSGSSGFGGGTVVFEIAGTSLIGVLNNTQARNLRIGGSN